MQVHVVIPANGEFSRKFSAINRTFSYTITAVSGATNSGIFLVTSQSTPNSKGPVGIEIDFKGHDLRVVPKTVRLRQGNSVTWVNRTNDEVMLDGAYLDA